MEQLGVDFKVVGPYVNEDEIEKSLGNIPLRSVAIELARAKSSTVASREPGATVVAADTMVLLHGKSLGKPKTPRHAIAMLQELSGSWHEVVTGVVVLGPRGSNQSAMVTRVKMKNVSTQDVESYVKTGDPLDKAGGYGIQGAGGELIETVDGCYLNVVGFPLCIVSELLSLSGHIQVDDPICLCSHTAQSHWDRHRHTESSGFRDYTVSTHPALPAFRQYDEIPGKS